MLERDCTHEQIACRNLTRLEEVMVKVAALVTSITTAVRPF